MAVSSFNEKKVLQDCVRVFKEVMSLYDKQISEAMVLIKSTSPVEAARARAEQMISDVKVKHLQDALAHAEDDTKHDEPKYVTTTDGRKFDVKDLEVF